MALTSEMPGTNASLVHAPLRRMSAIVLNYRTTDETFRALASLQASTRSPNHFIVVDNDAADECRSPFAELQSSRPESIYLHTGRNLGFSGGMNVGIRAALTTDAHYVVLANSDIEVTPDCLGRMESMLNGRAGAGIAGPLVLQHDARTRVASAGIRYNERSGRMREIGSGVTLSARLSGTRTVDAVSGCLMMVKREVFEAVGLLDDRYFFGFEDLDFCLRARAAGFVTVCVGDAVAFHDGGRSIGRQSSRRWYFSARNHLLLASHRGTGERLSTRALRLLWVAALNVAHALTAEAGSLAPRLSATFRGMRDHWRGRYGPDSVA